MLLPFLTWDSCIISKYCDRNPFTSNVDENMSPEICVHFMLITENCPFVNWALSSLRGQAVNCSYSHTVAVYIISISTWNDKKNTFIGEGHGAMLWQCVFKPILGFVLPLNHSDNRCLKCTCHIAWQIWLLINGKTGSSHYNQLSVVTSYRGISDYYSNEVVIIIVSWRICTVTWIFDSYDSIAKKPSRAIVTLGDFTEFDEE